MIWSQALESLLRHWCFLEREILLELREEVTSKWTGFGKLLIRYGDRLLKLRERRKQNVVSKDEDLYLSVASKLQGRMGEWSRMSLKAYSDNDERRKDRIEGKERESIRERKGMARVALTGSRSREHTLGMHRVRTPATRAGACQSPPMKWWVVQKAHSIALPSGMSTSL